MIRELDIRRRGEAILVGIAIESAILDFETSDKLLRASLDLLDTPGKGAAWLQIGVFGKLPVTLYIASDDSVSIVVDGPYFEANRSVCAMISICESDMRTVISKALSSLSCHQ